jgi:GDP-4-dehydro-6-deoxy-D-mannose reductase
VPGPLPPLSGRVGVTGASGFVGGWLMRHLRQVGGDALEVVPLLDRESGDIRDAVAVAEAVRDARPRAVVHLAAVAAPAEARRAPREAWEVNCIGTLNLAQAILAHAPDALLVHVGSAEVYGDSFVDATAPLAEEAPLRPRSVYGATKAAADIMIAQMAREGLRAVRFRPFNHTGPGQSADYVASAFARQIAQINRGLQEPILSVGNLEVERDLLDVRDVVAAYAAAVARPGAVAGQALNLATGRPVRVERLLGILLDLSGLEVEVRTDPARIRPDEVPTISGDARRAESLLDWRPSIPLDRTLADVLEHWKNRAAPA